MSGEDKLQFQFIRTRKIYKIAQIIGDQTYDHTMKLWERVIEQRPRKETQVTQFEYKEMSIKEFKMGG
jgi:hypothetical protein